MGAYGTSQGGGAWGGRSPPSLGGVGGYPPSRYFCLSVPWFVTGWLGHRANYACAIADLVYLPNFGEY